MFFQEILKRIPTVLSFAALLIKLNGKQLYTFRYTAILLHSNTFFSWEALSLPFKTREHI